ncbi:hypothetical protein FQR65_LT15052 [Abscondita terminalis]|nr:hypothetical protein FQR65_LT15052 [Abscondita terminalis]
MPVPVHQETLQLLEKVKAFQFELNKEGNINQQSTNFNEDNFEPIEVIKIKECIKSVNHYTGEIERILIARLSAINVDKQLINSNIKMSEKFDLRTAGNAIELYDSLLDDNGKKLLTTFILKTRLSQSAKIRLQKEYSSNTELIKDINKHLISKQSTSALSVKLNSVRQGNKTIEEFGKTVEELLVNLTISQADGNDDALKILKNVNEKIAINSFANGLENKDARKSIRQKYDVLKTNSEKDFAITYKPLIEPLSQIVKNIDVDKKYETKQEPVKKEENEPERDKDINNKLKLFIKRKPSIIDRRRNPVSPLAQLPYFKRNPPTTLHPPPSLMQRSLISPSFLESTFIWEVNPEDVEELPLADSSHLNSTLLDSIGSEAFLEHTDECANIRRAND